MRGFATMKGALLALLLAAATAAYAELEPTVSQEVELAAGWNLVRLEGRPLMSAAFRKLCPHCYDAENSAYVRCVDAASLQEGSVVWLYCDAARTEAIAWPAGSPQPSGDASLAPWGWSLAGAASAEPAWLPEAKRLWLWDARQLYRPAAAPVAGQGAWASRE